MERKARDSRDSTRKLQHELVPWPWGLVRRQIIPLGLLAAALLVAPSWRTVVAVGLMLGVYAMQLGIPGVVGPHTGVVAGVVVTRSLFLEDSEGRTRAWLGLESEYGDEHGPRLVFYDEKGQARLALRLVEERRERDLDRPDAEVVPTEGDSEKSKLTEPAEPALVMFNEDGKINLSLWSNQDYPALTASSARGDAGLQPGEIWLMSPGGKQDVWRAS